jgi:hypothetical protein
MHQSFQLSISDQTEWLSGFVKILHLFQSEFAESVQIFAERLNKLIVVYNDDFFGEKNAQTQTSVFIEKVKMSFSVQKEENSSGMLPTSLKC